MTSSTRSLLLKTLLPVAIGIGVVVWLFGSEFSISQFRQIPLSSHVAWAIILAILMVAGRELGMMWRWRVLTDRQLSWWQTLKVTLMCEFTSCVTPTTGGGSALSMIFLHREGINLGRGASITMITLMLDELFFVVTGPVIVLLMPHKALFGFTASTFVGGVTTAFWIVYAGIVGVTIFLFLGALVWPRHIARALNRLFSLRLLRRWLPAVEELGRNLTAAGADLRTRPASWWIEAFTATALSWICRYLVVNALFLAFATSASQMVVFARQFVVWTLLTVSPTPGASGISEWLFTNYYGDMLADTSTALVIAIIWRILTYYLYLLLGIITLPLWLRHSPSPKQ